MINILVKFIKHIYSNNRIIILFINANEEYKDGYSIQGIMQQTNMIGLIIYHHGIDYGALTSLMLCKY